MNKIGRRLAPWTALALIAGCANKENALPTFPSLSMDKKPSVETTEIKGPVTGNASNKTDFSSGPAAPVEHGPGQVGEAPPKLTGAPVSLALDQVPIPAFIDTVFGKILKLNYDASQVASRTETVTLRTGGDRSPQEIYALAGEVLRNYGIRVLSEKDLVKIVPDQTLAAEMPMVIRGRTLPDVPGALRPVFQVYAPNSVSVGDMQNWLISAFGKRVQITSFGASGLLMIAGLPEDVRGVLDGARLLDQPRLAGRRSIKVEPVYWSVTRLGIKLAELLKAEGYSASNTIDGSSIILLPVEPINLLVVFANDPAAMAHVSEWVRQLDQPAKADPLKKTFIYPVANTTAESLGEVLGGIIGGGGSGSARGGGAAGGGATAVPSLTQSGINSNLPGQQQGSLGSTSAAATTTPTPAGQSSAEPGVRTIGTPTGAHVVIDEARNAIIFLGTAEDYAQVLPVLEALDRAPRECLIEVTVAEVTLTDDQNLGVEWSLPFSFNGNTGSVGTVGGLGVPALPSNGTASSSGLTAGFTNQKGIVRAVLNAFASTQHLNVLLTPRILARSGTQATINVGDQVPIITSQATSGITVSGTTGIVNSVSYVQTGTQLQVKPTVHSGDRIDLEISQQVSDSTPNSTSGISSPIISTRAIQTKLSLQDGGTVLLGGLIQTQRSNNNTGIPFISDVPGLGLLFKNQNTTLAKTELLVFITPYIVASPQDADRIAQQLERDTETWPSIPGQLTW